MAKVWLLAAVLLLSSSSRLSGGSPLHAADRQNAVTFFKTRLKNTLSPAPSSSFSSSPSSLSSEFTCETCKTFFEVVQELYDEGFVRDEIANICVDVCTVLKIEDHTVCSGVVSLFKDEVLTVFEKVGLSSDEACNIVVGDSCSKGYDPWHQKWTIHIPGDKPPVTHHSPPPGNPVTSVLHITDIHYDPLYTPGLTHDCGEPLCCRPPNAKGNSSTGAGYWGDYKCDIPYHTLLNLMEHLQTQSSLYEWVYWTGDMPAHSVWTTTRQGLLDMMTNITDLMATYFGSKPVFPTFGNHEGAPVNSFPPPYITGNESSQWLYSGSAERWAVWLDKYPEWPTINATIRKGGYYVVRVREHLKVISLQTNFCNTGNYWLLINSTDPADQLKWLVEQLLQAERDGDKVHIIGHIAPGLSSCNPVWSSNYNNIVNRFESTIVGQFFGHTHQDSVKIHYDNQNFSRATNVVYITQSVTTYQYLNLGYRIFVIDGDYNESTSCVVDHINYYMDLSKTSETTPPIWEFEYSAKTDYEMPDLQPQSWSELVTRFQKNNTLFMKFYHHDSKMYSAEHGQQCDGVCVCELLCETVTAISGDRKHCAALSPTVGNKTISCGYTDTTDFHKSRQHC